MAAVLSMSRTNRLKVNQDGADLQVNKYMQMSIFIGLGFLLL